MRKYGNYALGRVSAAALHFLLSASVAVVTAVLVFSLWYPYPYREISSGREIFTLIVAVDVVLGPLITFVIFNPLKSHKELFFDLSIVGVIQVFALVYGLWMVAVARPVHIVFEFDRFRVVHAIDVDELLLTQAQKNIKTMPLDGPTLLALRPFKDEKERLDATLAALQGVSLASRPDLWRPYDEATVDILSVAKSVADLMSQFPSHSDEIQRALIHINKKPNDVVYLPLVGRKTFWTVFLDGQSARVLTIIPIDSF